MRLAGLTVIPATASITWAVFKAVPAKVTRFPWASPERVALAAEISVRATAGVMLTNCHLGTDAVALNAVTASTSRETILILPVTWKILTAVVLKTSVLFTVPVRQTIPLLMLRSPTLARVDGL